MAFFGGADQSLQIVIKARDDASKVLNGINSNIKNNAKELKNLGVKMTAIGAVASVAIGKMVKDASKFKSLEVSYNRLTQEMKIDSDLLIEKLNEVSAGTVANTDLMLSANKAMALGVGDDMETMTTLMEIARLKGRALGLDTTQAFNDIVTGIGRGSPLILDNLGIIIKLGETQENYAKQLGKTVEEMTDAEKSQALLNAVLKTGKEELEAVGEMQLTTDEKWQQLIKSIKDITVELGEKLLPVLSDLFDKIKPIIDKTIDWIEKNEELTGKILLGVAAFTALLVVLGPLLILLPGIVTAFTILISPVGLIILAIGTLTALIYNQIKGWDQFGKSLEVIANYLKKGLGKVLEYVSGKIKNLTKDIGILVKSLGAAVKDSKITKLGEKIGSSIEWGMGKAGIAVENTMNDIGTITNAATSKIQEGMSTAGNFIVEKWQGVKSSTLGNIEDMLGGMGETTTKMMEDFKSSMGDLEIANENATKKLNESGKKIQDDFKKYISTVKDFNTGIKNEIEATIGKIADLQQKLVDVEKDYNEKRKDNNMSYAQAYLDQENKIKDTKEEIANTSDIKDKNRLQTKLAEQISVLEQFSSLEKTYHTEIEFLRAEALKSELQRQVEKLKEKERHELAEYSRVKEKILKEITAETQKYEDLKALQAKGLEEYAKYLASSETMTADSIDREIAKYNELAKAVERARQAQSSFSGYSFSVQNTVAGLGPTFNDFISRPGSAPVSFSPDDTIIGVKNPEKLGGGVTININNPTVRDDRDIDRMRDMMDDYFRTVMVNNKITA